MHPVFGYLLGVVTLERFVALFDGAGFDRAAPGAHRVGPGIGDPFVWAVSIFFLLLSVYGFALAGGLGFERHWDLVIVTAWVAVVLAVLAALMSARPGTRLFDVPVFRTGFQLIVLTLLLFSHNAVPALNIVTGLREAGATVFEGSSPAVMDVMGDVFVALVYSLLATLLMLVNTMNLRRSGEVREAARSGAWLRACLHMLVNAALFFALAGRLHDVIPHIV